MVRRLACALLLAGLPTAQGAAQRAGQAVRLWSSGPFTADGRALDVARDSSGVKLSGPSPALLQTGSSFAANRSIVFAGDRIVLFLDAGERPGAAAKASQSVTELVSVDRRTGAVRATRDLTELGQVTLFATHDGDVLVSGARVLRLTPDLRDDGSFEAYDPSHRRPSIRNISPDGATLGNSLHPGFELVDTHTLRAGALSDLALVDSSVSNKGVLTDKILWPGFPDDTHTVDYVDAAGDHRVYHGPCGSDPTFLTDTLLLEQGCRDALLMDTQGGLLRKIPMKLPWAYGGVSQNGERFALQITRPGGLFSTRREWFTVYATATGKPLASVRPDRLPLEQSWTAFSPDGVFFVVGSPLKLTLYRLP